MLAITELLCIDDYLISFRIAKVSCNPLEECYIGYKTIKALVNNDKL